MKCRGDHRDISVFNNRVQNVANHGFPVDYKRAVSLNRILESIGYAFCGTKFQFHGRLSFERNPLPYSDNGSDSIKKTSGAGGTRTPDAFLQHLSQERRFASGECGSAHHLVEEARGSMPGFSDGRVTAG